ncbi:MAG TPA: hypothetical protein DGQ94_21160 [Pseudomonas sp.]|uniref:ribonuclease T2 family protein n=1 Tax=Pseudomonas sp. TaxID=306 RepID=UPI000EE84350|nr:hypothetical protein [Pseudomonas sp.]
MGCLRTLRSLLAKCCLSFLSVDAVPWQLLDWKPRRWSGAIIQGTESMRLLIAILLLLTTAWANSAVALDANEDAYVDAPPTRYLVYAVTWQPTFCRMRPTTAGCAQPPQRFMTHGVWPYSEGIGDRTNRHPQFCTTSPACNKEACAMGDEDMKAVLSNGPLRALVTREPEGMFAHEWKKHGTCAGKTMQSY